jgi:hypothetical protein
MLRFEDARSAVHRSVQKVSPATVAFSDDTPLSGVGVGTMPEIWALIHMIVSDEDVGLPSVNAELGIVSFSLIDASATVGSLVKSFELSARKLCSNPVQGHPQPCCPYPSVCAQCNFPVR